MLKFILETCTWREYTAAIIGAAGLWIFLFLGVCLL